MLRFAISPLTNNKWEKNINFLFSQMITIVKNYISISLLSYHKSGIEVFTNQSHRVKIDDSELGKQVTKKIAIARASILLDYPFFGYILGKLSIVPTIEIVIQKFSVDNSFLYFNTNYASDIVEIQSDWKERMKGDLIHLVLHLIYDHATRKKDRDTKVWAFASDLIVYQVMSDLAKLMGKHDIWGLPTLTWLPDEFFNISTERVYQMFLDNIDPEDKSSKSGDQQIDKEDMIEKISRALTNYSERQPNQPPVDISNFADYLCDLNNFPQDHMDEETNQLNQSVLNGIIRDAYEKSKERGELPSNFKIFLGKKFSSKTNWRIQLSNYLQKVIGFDTTWRFPNKRHIANGFYFPSTSKENIQLLIAVDTSGSVHEMLLQKFLAEIEMILNQISNVRIILVECDADIQNMTFVEAGERLNITSFHGGGGTDFRPVFDLINKYDIDLLIYFTDGDGIYPTKQVTEPPVLWILTSDYKVPFGNTIMIE